jgi:hypothetical protein
MVRHPKCDAFLIRLREECETVLRSGTRAGEKLLREARSDRREGAAMLERALPNFKGLPEAGLLQALLTELRRP